MHAANDGHFGLRSSACSAASLPNALDVRHSIDEVSEFAKESRARSTWFQFQLVCIDALIRTLAILERVVDGDAILFSAALTTTYSKLH